MEAESLQITVNGEERLLDESPISIAQLLQQRGVEPRYCAVELNGEIVPQKEFSAIYLRNGDQVELVTLVGGG